MEIESKQPHTSSLRGRQILERRKEIEQELVELIKKIGGGSSVEEVKDMIFNEENKEDFNNLVAMFSVAENLDELNRDLQLVSDAWNYFPHKVLGGISPAEVILKHQSQSALYECPECHLKYKDKERAEKCEAWCKAHHSCNLEITAHAEK